MERKKSARQNPLRGYDERAQTLEVEFNNGQRDAVFTPV